MSVKPGWCFLDEGELQFIISGDELRALEYLADCHGPNDAPAFTCWKRVTKTTYRDMKWVLALSDPPEFVPAGWVTGYEYGEEWLNGGNPGMLIEGTRFGDTNPFDQMETEE